MVLDLPSGAEDAGLPPAPERSEPDALLARRAQILATEHWGLLAARGTAQSEVLTRITIYLTLVSAGLVTIGLLGQATRFDGWFTGAALAILSFLALVGLMTQTRVFNVAEEDLMYVVAMNRLRGAYVDLDPAVERYLLAGITDDVRGAERTYSFLRRRSFTHLFGSSFILIMVVNAGVLGLLAGASVVAAGGAVAWGIAVGIVVAVVDVAVSVTYGQWTYKTAWRNHQPLRRAADESPSEASAPSAASSPASASEVSNGPTAPVSGAPSTTRRAARSSGR